MTVTFINQVTVSFNFEYDMEMLKNLHVIVDHTNRIQVFLSLAFFGNLPDGEEIRADDLRGANHRTLERRFPLDKKGNNEKRKKRNTTINWTWDCYSAAGLERRWEGSWGVIAREGLTRDPSIA